jgi:hypothetical protein
MAPEVNADLVSKVKAIFRFDVTGSEGTKIWVVDLKNGNGILF